MPESMEGRKLKLLTDARKKHPNEEIYFCGTAQSWDECITEEEGRLMLWYNIGDNTKLIKEGE